MLPAFGWHAVLTNWEFAPVVTAATVLAGAAYLWGAWRVGRRHPARPWPWWRTALFLGGLAVPAAFGALLPRWLVVTGLILAVAAEFSSLCLLASGFAYLLPIARFGGLAWLIIAGALLPTTRSRASQ